MLVPSHLGNPCDVLSEGYMVRAQLYSPSTLLSTEPAATTKGAAATLYMSCDDAAASPLVNR